MRVMRSSVFTSMNAPAAITTVVRDEDITDTLESMHVGGEANNPAEFVVSEIFELPDGTDIASATITAVRRYDDTQQKRERDMATAYFWNVNHVLPMMQGEGVVMGTEPWPLSNDDIAYVMERIARHPNYKDQTFVMLDESGIERRYKNGTVIE